MSKSPITAAEKTRWASDRGVPRWMALAMWEDVYQVAALIEWQYQSATPAQRYDALRHALRCLRREIWDRRPTRQPKTPASLRPSKLAAVTGYRRDPARHQSARNKVDVERRKQIAAMGAAGRRNG